MPDEGEKFDKYHLRTVKEQPLLQEQIEVPLIHLNFPDENILTSELLGDSKHLMKKKLKLQSVHSLMKNFMF